MLSSRKGEMGGMAASALAIVILILVVTIGSAVTSGLAKSQCPTGYVWTDAYNNCCVSGSACTAGTSNESNTVASNITRQGLSGGLKTFGDYFAVIVLIVVAALVIGLLMRGMSGIGSS